MEIVRIAHRVRPFIILKEFRYLMVRYVCYVCKYLMTKREHVITLRPERRSTLNFECKNPNCNIRRGTVIAKLPPYLYRLRKAR